MSSSLYQSLQSCLEPHILGLKLAHPKPANKVLQPKNEMIAGPNPSQNTCTADFEKAENKETVIMEKKVYVHSLIKRSASFLSDKSLEMCTESLFSETGSGNSTDETESFALFENITTHHRLDDEESRMKKFMSRKKRNLIRANSFPPPLSSKVHVKPAHREGGRLVLQAVCFPSSNALFHAERSQGRLRLRLLRPDGGSIKEADDLVPEDNDHEEDDAFVVVDDDDDSFSAIWDTDGNNEDGAGGIGNENNNKMLEEEVMVSITRVCKSSKEKKAQGSRVVALQA